LTNAAVPDLKEYFLDDNPSVFYNLSVKVRLSYLQRGVAMGTTFSSIHVYSSSEVYDLPNFYSFSAGWQTYITEEVPKDLFEFRALAKKISRSIDAPVLWFCIFDSESLLFEFYKNGKKAASYSQMDSNGCKNLYGIPALIGYDSAQKRRLSKILSCADIDFQLELLEEYFGVCLIPLFEIFQEEPNALSRVRGEERYMAFLAEEKKLSGKRSPIKVELVSEQTGKLFEHKFDDEDKRSFKPYHYYFGYDTFASTFKSGALRPVRFEHGRLVSVTEEEFDAAPKVLSHNARVDERFSEEFYPTYKIHFTDKAPEGLKNKTLVTPRGFYFNWFDEKGRAILSDERGGIAVVDETLKVIAKIRVKGTPVSYADGHILTVGSESFFAYYYNPSDVVRIYRVYDK